LARKDVIDQMIEALGLEKERFELIWCSSAEADRFVSAVTEMTEKVRALGPSPFNPAVSESAAAS
jgi:F420-non-reducing hydrogenase iron-sulfur subunit